MSTLDWKPLTEADLTALTNLALCCLEKDGGLPLLATEPMLRQLFLTPLTDERDGGDAAKDTLRAYYQASGNASSAAAALGVHRRTVTARLEAIEERLGRRLENFSAEIETALRLDAIENR